MLGILARNWWSFLLRGILAILFGIMALFWPGLTLLTLVLLFGAYAVVDGVLAIASGISSTSSNERWWILVIQGILGILAGIIAFVAPGITAITLLFFFAAWQIISGIFTIIGAIQLRKVIEGEWFMILSGIVSILFGVILFAFPGAGILSVLWLIAFAAIALGVMLIILSFRLRGLRDNG